MQNTFTVHCIPWQAGAPLLQDIRVTAIKAGLMDQTKAQADKFDEQCRHAIALSKNGNAIGCARITQDGQIEHMVILPHEQRALVEAALIEVLNEYSNLSYKQ